MRQVGLVRVLIGVLCAGAFLLIVLIAMGSEIDETSGRAIGTAIAIAFFSLTGVAGTNLVRRRPELTLYGYFTAGASALALVTMIASLWTDDFRGDSWRPAVYTLIFAFATGHASVLLASARDEDSGNVRMVRSGTILALAALVVLTFVEIASPGRDVGAQSIGVVAVLYVLGTIVLALLRRTSPPGTRPSEPATAEAPSASGWEPEALRVDHACLAWDGTIATALEYLRRHQVEVIAGPIARLGAHGPGHSIYFHDPDGNLVELIAYKD